MWWLDHWQKRRETTTKYCLVDVDMLVISKACGFIGEGESSFGRLVKATKSSASMK